MKSKILGTLYMLLLTLLIVGLVRNFSFGYIGENQKGIEQHYKKTERY